MILKGTFAPGLEDVDDLLEPALDGPLLSFLRGVGGPGREVLTSSAFAAVSSASLTVATGGRDFFLITKGLVLREGKTVFAGPIGFPSFADGL